MFSGLLEPLRRHIGLRLSLLYALIFTGVLVRIVRVSDYLAYQLLSWPL